ncbi:MAG: Maf family protein [Planctomycetota bacterium]|nr:Maf family protein [Planctomycetota bacterium]
MTTPRPLILASRSPRRADLLAQAGIEFEAKKFPDVDETPGPGLDDPRAIVRDLAERKARSALLHAPHEWLLTADTLVFLDDAILGKPDDAAEAHAMLSALSGRSHIVATGVALTGAAGRGRTRLLSDATATHVRFRDLSRAEIDAYVASGEPLGKAGAYAIQGGGGEFVHTLEGAEDTVIGLPIELVRRLLADW